MLNPEQVKQWKEEGYVIVPDFFDTSEVDLMKADLERMIEEGHGRNPVTAQDGETPDEKRINFQIIPLNNKSPLFKALPFLPKVKESVKQLLGDNVVRFLDQIFMKPGKSGVGTNWHTDNAYFASKAKTEGTGLWIALQDSNLENGTMQVIPKSHLEDPKHERDLSSDHHITCAGYIDPKQAVPVIVPAGGVVFFNFGVAHCTGDNLTDQPRAGAAFHFATPQAAMESSYYNKEGQNLILISGEDEGHGFYPYKEDADLSTWDREPALVS